MTSPKPKYWRGCVPGIPRGVDASATYLVVLIVVVVVAASDSVASNRIEANFGTIILRIYMHRLTESDFGYYVILARYMHMHMHT